MRPTRTYFSIIDASCIIDESSCRLGGFGGPASRENDLACIAAYIIFQFSCFCTHHIRRSLLLLSLGPCQCTWRRKAGPRAISPSKKPLLSQIHTQTARIRPQTEFRLNARQRGVDYLHTRPSSLIAQRANTRAAELGRCLMGNITQTPTKLGFSIDVVHVHATASDVPFSQYIMDT